MHISEAMNKAAHKLRAAIRHELSPATMPDNDTEIYAAIDAIVTAVVAELVIEWRRAKP